MVTDSNKKNSASSDIDTLINCLPNHIQLAINLDQKKDDLLEIVMDLGRLPQARYSDGPISLGEKEVDRKDIMHVTSRIGQFNDDNRAGLERTLHRISAMRNRQNEIVALTCRVGRAIFGTIRIIEDLINSDNNLLLLGPPGIGKTTMLREVAQVLADDLKKRVVIVDTSNEIAGDGDIPHSSLGAARRMQVPQPHLQHTVMIEAVENHMPEAIIIDEIGTEAETNAARTIAERGVKLVGTAHGTSLDSLVRNPTLCDLIGGIQTVTLGDDEAKRRRTQKTVLERKSSPTFNVVIEIRSRTEVAVHTNVEKSVDIILRGGLPRPQVRNISTTGDVEKVIEHQPDIYQHQSDIYQIEGEEEFDDSDEANIKRDNTSVFGYGIGKSRLEFALSGADFRFTVATKVEKADVLITTKQMYRKKSPILKSAEERRIPVLVLRKNTSYQLDAALKQLETKRYMNNTINTIIEETEKNLETLIDGDIDEIELSPQNAYVRKIQHQIAETANLSSYSSGQEPNRSVFVFRDLTQSRNI